MLKRLFKGNMPCGHTGKEAISMLLVNVYSTQLITSAFHVLAIIMLLAMVLDNT